MRPTPPLWILALALASACSDPRPDRADPGREPAAGFPLVLAGDDGSECRLEAPAGRVLAGNAGALDLFLEVASPDHVVAINRGTRPYSVALTPSPEDPTPLSEIDEIDRFDLESVATLAPDLVLTHAWQTLDKGPFLERLGVPRLVLSEASGLADLERDLERLAAAVGTPERGARAVEALRMRVARLSERDRSAWSALAYSGAESGGWSSGSGTTAASLIGWAGLRNLAEERGMAGHFQVDHELLLDLDPRVLVVPSDDGTLEGSSTWRALRSDERLAALAVRRDEGLVVPIESRLFGTTSHHLVGAAEALAAALDGWVDAGAGQAGQNARK